MAERRAVFTSIIGRYESLRELDGDRPTDVDYYCFTDDANATSTTWQLVMVDPPFASDPIRSQRRFKILGHPVLDDYRESLYLDNSVRLTASPHVVLDDWLASADLAFPRHSFRESTEDEFVEVLASSIDSDERVREQLEHYRVEHPGALAARPHWNGMIARRRSDLVDRTMEVWYSHVLRYSRRDQLSLSAAIETTGIAVHSVAIDNYRSSVHEWPMIVDRNVSIRMATPPNYRARTIAAEARIADLEAERAHILSSLSWRITAPIRLAGRVARMGPRRIVRAIGRRLPRGRSAA